MRKRASTPTVIAFAVLGVLLAGLLPDAARAEAVVQVVTVRLDGDPRPYLDLVQKSQAVTKRLGLPALQAAQATFAGTATRELYVWAEYASLEALGQAAPKLEADAEWQALLKQFEATGRKVVSQEVWRDRTPAGLTPTPASPGGVASVLAVTLDGDPKAYLDLLARFGPLSKRLGISAPRVWQATFAGPETRTIFIVLQYADLAAVGEFTEKTESDAEWRSFVQQADATGRKVVGQSLIRHRIP
jgi:hypothetical protein